jgi:hypothetical protein
MLGISKIASTYCLRHCAKLFIVLVNPHRTSVVAFIMLILHIEDHGSYITCPVFSECFYVFIFKI